MRIKYTELQTPDGLRSAYFVLPDGAYDENWKSSSITILREASDEASVRDLIENAQLGGLVDGGVQQKAREHQIGFDLAVCAEKCGHSFASFVVFVLRPQTAFSLRQTALRYIEPELSDN